ncbi:MAG TPA: regulatory protein RecX [Cyclobacteriaceae bacterium]|nr:regulatory protein RecX [Cyclobacteriaceae bacterium]
MTIKNKVQTLQEAKQKIQGYCAYQERCHQEVRNRLYEMGLGSNQIDELMVNLISEGFLNEERFAKAFAGGKFRMKNWGKIKITHSLESKGLGANCIRTGLEAIDDNDYLNTLTRLLTRKAEEISGENAFERRNLIAKYAIQKGFEPDLVWKVLKDLLPD